jgi:hypothetical protein
MIDVITQMLIAAMSLSATYLSLHPTRQKWACFFGLIVQPLWMISTSANHQWGMLALCFVYGGIWLRSFWRHWSTPVVELLWRTKQ